MLLAKTLSYTLINNKPQPPEGVAAVAEHLPIRTKSYIWEYSPPITLGTSAGGAHSAQTALLAYFLRAVELERIFGHGNGSYRSDEQLKFPSPKMRISGRSGRVTVARVKAFFLLPKGAEMAGIGRRTFCHGNRRRTTARSRQGWERCPMSWISHDKGCE